MPTDTPPLLAPIAPGLFFDETATPEDARLIGARDEASGRVVFPCPQPLPEGFVPVALAREGVLWSYTVQRFRPKTPPYAGPEEFEPYAVGYVDLGGEVIVEGLLTGIPFEDLAVGLPVHLTVRPVSMPGDGVAATFAFRRAEHRA